MSDPVEAEDGDVAAHRLERGRRAEEMARELTAAGVHAVALTWVDNAGVTRVKVAPVTRFGHVASWGVGMSPVFDVFLVDDSITNSKYAGGPAGDLRLYPDLDRLSVLAAQPGWAWAPVDRYTQEGRPYACCQRTFARTAVAEAALAGLDLKMAFEIEWFLGHPDLTPAAPGAAYGMDCVVGLSEYVDDLLTALDAQGVPVDQFHPEYAPGQLELSVAAADPVGAADRNVLVRQTIKAVSRKHGYQASFSPVVQPDQVGNGQHLHLSAREHGRTLFSGGDGPYGLTGRAESMLAGLLERLPALTAISTPSAASRLRLTPQRWAAAYQCWGRENREAAMRLVTGSTGERDQAANAELKCCDGSANPYLVVGAVTAIAAATFRQGQHLPPEVPGDPALQPEQARPLRIPNTGAEAIAALRGDDVLPGQLGEPLLEAYCAVRQAEDELFANASPQEIAAASRWRY